jgi:HAMP domain-containing protein
MAPGPTSDVAGLIGAVVFGTCAYVVTVLLFRRALPLGRLAR